MVGEYSSRIKAWDDVILKLRSRLSKWKVKTLSIGGRLTLLKSVLGASPIYNMSIFKVPTGVLKVMESIRSRFFNGDRWVVIGFSGWYTSGLWSIGTSLMRRGCGGTILSYGGFGRCWVSSGEVAVVGLVPHAGHRSRSGVLDSFDSVLLPRSKPMLEGVFFGVWRAIKEQRWGLGGDGEVRLWWPAGGGDGLPEMMVASV
ncbi:hypothetical protein Tco_0526985 [Tanacetum coccineum]